MHAAMATQRDVGSGDLASVVVSGDYPWRKYFTVRALAFAAGFLLLFELLARWAYAPERLARMKPADPLSMISVEKYANAVTAGTRPAAALIGDSVTAQAYLDNPFDLAEKLEGEAKVRVVNLSLIGAKPGDVWNVGRRALAGKPDAVLVAVNLAFLNDAPDKFAAGSRVVARPALMTPEDRQAFRVFYPGLPESKFSTEFEADINRRIESVSTLFAMRNDIRQKMLRAVGVNMDKTRGVGRRPDREIQDRFVAPGADDPKVRAMFDLAKRARVAGVPILFFTVPENLSVEPIRRRHLSPERARFFGMLEQGFRKDGAWFLVTDSTLYGPDDFRDHIHLEPSGNKILGDELGHYLAQLVKVR
jgi:hypothetical protein